jgi:hypothetical protein
MALVVAGTTITAYGGVVEADNWRLSTTAGYASAGRQVITSNWERNDTNFEQIGTGMSESSGNFSFPSTGKWLINLQYSWTSQDSGGTNRAHVYVFSEIEATTDNSSYDRIAKTTSSNDDAGAEYYLTGNCSVMLDVTNTTNQKVNFSAYMANGIFVRGHSSTTETAVTFLKLGDT